MNAWEILEKIRSRSPEEKRLFSFFIAAGLTAVIAISWATVKLSSDDPEQEIVDERSSPFAAMSAQFKALRREFTDMKEETAPVVNELDGMKNDFVDVMKNGSSSEALKYLQLDEIEEIDTELEGEVIIEAEIEDEKEATNQTGTSTQDTGEIEQSS